jgi:hypothetical protein
LGRQALTLIPSQDWFSPDYKGITYQRPDGTFLQEVGFGSGVLNPDEELSLWRTSAHSLATTG